jgi:protein-S-isoprenylcysteine O-methyltransferase Ste14
MDRLVRHPGYAWALFFVAAAIFYLGTGSLRGAAICLLLEIILWTAVRQFRKRQAQ